MVLIVHDKRTFAATPPAGILLLTYRRKENRPSMPLQKSAVTHLNQGLRIFFSQFVRVSLRHPSQALFFARTVLWQAGAARRRAREARAGLHVPPIAIFSITNRCW